MRKIQSPLSIAAMNKSQLQHDLNCDALISAARQRRRRQIATLSAVPAVPAVLIGLSLWLWLPSSTPPEIANVSLPSQAPSSQQTPPTLDPAPVSQREIIQSDDELLALLADYGPILVEDRSGKQSLYLTSPQNQLQVISN